MLSLKLSWYRTIHFKGALELRHPFEGRDSGQSQHKRDSIVSIIKQNNYDMHIPPEMLGTKWCISTKSCNPAILETQLG